ncbi:CGNR zinc finger domain-containing protein [Streptomyces sp. NPDC020330]|uniref:CGNR zinc finger domain-containing protein n=1 Tax=unclassified Streptomyces TaxID=2593676 RepID=UPI0037A237C7
MSHPPGADPRPLTGEPLALDLLNTRWIDGSGPHDLLDSMAGLGVWLNSPAVRDHLDPTPAADPATRDRLLLARTALDTLVASAARQDPATPESADRLNEVLSHGRIRRTLGPDGAPMSAVEMDDPSWAPAWYAAENWLRLVADRPDRIRPCANHACILHFYDVSKNGTRRWCSMAGCGNRAKAQRHYARRSGA